MATVTEKSRRGRPRIYPQEERVCETCHETFTFTCYPDKPGRYCSQLCAQRGTVGRKLVEKLGHTKMCEACGDEYQTYKKQQRFCSVACYNDSTPPRPSQPCEFCGEQFTPTNVRPRRYCSNKCSGMARITHPPRTCEQCGGPFRSRDTDARFCSKDCHYDSYPGRTITGQGYVLVRVPKGTAGVIMRKGSNRPWMLEHRYVMQCALGRPIEEPETVHHKNGDKLDNRIENLELRVGPHGRGATKHCLTCTCEEH